MEKNQKRHRAAVISELLLADTLVRLHEVNQKLAPQLIKLKDPAAIEQLMTAEYERALDDVEAELFKELTGARCAN
jgi:hypothetical protein